MSVKAITRSLKTADITVVSNATSLHVQGDKVTKLSAIPGQLALLPLRLKLFDGFHDVGRIHRRNTVVL
jgi:hypothetical protein